MLEEEKAVLEIMQLAYLVQLKTKYCVFVRYFGHVDNLDIDVRESKERWNLPVFTSEIVTAYGEHRKTRSPKLAELKAKIDVLKRILEDGEVPYDELDYEEVITRKYSL